MTESDVLCGTGWVPWAAVRELLGGWDAAWSDLAGAHLGVLPEEAPSATHLWAWRGDVWARVRIDDDEAVAGLLHPVGQCPQPGECSGTAVATTTQTPASSWPEKHIRLAETLRSIHWQVRTVSEGVTTTFVRQGERVYRSS